VNVRTVGQAAACGLILALASSASAVRRATADPQDGLSALFQRCFPDYAFGGAYLDPADGYLVVSLDVRPQAVARAMSETGWSIDQILVDSMARGLYALPLSLYLLSSPAIHGVCLRLVWKGYSRVRVAGNTESVFPSSGLSEEGMFRVSRDRYFRPLDRKEEPSRDTISPRIFDTITFYHFGNHSYDDLPGHRTQQNP